MNSYNIKCSWHSEENRNFYIDENLKVLPCCYYQVPEKVLKELDPKFFDYSQKNADWNNLTKHTIEEITSTEIYNKHIWYPGWNNDPSGLCVKNCGKNMPVPHIVKSVIKPD